MRRVIPLVLLVCLAVSIDPVAAQDPSCDPTAFLSGLAKYISTGDNKQDHALVDTLEEALRAFRADCAPYHLEGKGEALTEIIELPAGVYRAEIKSTDSFVGDIEVITGECEMEYFSATHGMTETSRIIRSEGCRAAFQFSVSRAPWEVVIVPLD